MRVIQPCALIAASSKAYLAATPSASAFKVPVDLARECLYSAPFKPTPARDLVQSLRPLVEFHSTLDYLKDPQTLQPNYPYPPVDAKAELDKIERQINSGHFQSEIAFQKTLSELSHSFKDGHVGWQFGLNSVFDFRRTQFLVSISTDGTSLPDIYSHSDIAILNRTFTPSRITQINGQDAYKLLLNESSKSTYQDLDTNYEQHFWGWTQRRIGGGEFLSGIGIDLEQELTLTFANGSTKRYNNTAVSRHDFTGISDGETLYQRFAAPWNFVEAVAEPSKPKHHTTGSLGALLASAFPNPVASDPDGLISGYLPQAKDLEDVAVLDVRSFMPHNSTTGRFGFSAAASSIIARLRQSGRKKLLIDVSGNGGGEAALGEDLFAQLFPNITQKQYLNMRAHEAMNLIGDYATDLMANTPLQEQFAMMHEEGNLRPVILSPGFNAKTAYQPNGNGVYPSWRAFFGPGKEHSPAVSQTFYHDFHTDLVSNQLFNVSGVGNHAAASATPAFDPRNILAVSDGLCGSTCALLLALLKNQAGVRSIAIGGAPTHGPMQAVGAVKGGRAVSFWNIFEAVAAMANMSRADIVKQGTNINVTCPSSLRTLLPETFLEKYNNTAIGTIHQSIGYFLSRLSRRSALHAGINHLNILRHGDEAAIPGQFLYEAADCRIFTTEAMVHNVTAVWAAAANAMFGDGQCVKDSERHPSSLTGGNGGFAVY